MNAPYVETFSTVSYVVASLVLGFFFGFFLERAGFSSARKLTDQFYFKDFAVLKVMFTAIIVAMLGIAYFSLLGWLNFGQVYVPETFVWPQLLGGILLGAGFILGGYCPGTSLVAAAIGKIDALLFMVGNSYRDLRIWRRRSALPEILSFRCAGCAHHSAVAEPQSRSGGLCCHGDCAGRVLGGGKERGQVAIVRQNVRGRDGRRSAS